ncbi:hypothetical protein SH668x_002484 [Planctomicrobium sp. SH668]|uniref:hypothetical protein n=1 Tax=Planctomicrobium sp. SH668 TaxID=3448126 RepID=UPI003F5C4BB8
MPPGKTPKPTAGQIVQVLAGVNMPEFDDLPIGGWKGTVLETSGTGAKLKIILEWDEATAALIPASYQAHCDSQGLLYTMACLPASDVQVVN